MHTTMLETKYYGTVTLHHNGDWSGDVLINYADKDGVHSIELPADLLLALGREAALEFVASQVVSLVQDLRMPALKMDDERMRVGDLPSVGDCEICDQPIRIGAHDYGSRVSEAVQTYFHQECADKKWGKKP